MSRRGWLRSAALASGGWLASSSATSSWSSAGWFKALADDTAGHPQRQRACVLLWMSGGPSQTDTFDLKTGHANGGEFKPIDTAVPGIQISEHLPNLAKVMDQLAVIRSMSTKEGDHQRATYLMRTGYLPQGPIHYPTLGSLISQQLGRPGAEMPNFVSIAPSRFLSPTAFGPGFLGPQYAPLIVGEDGPNGAAMNNSDAALSVRNLALPTGVDRPQADARLGLLKQLEDDFSGQRPGTITRSHQAAYQSAVKLMRSESRRAFQLDEEPAALRDQYGRNQFGQGCLLARRLIEAGVPFVEVTLSNAGQNGIGWDTHQDNFTGVKALCDVLDPAWATLMTDLKQRGLLDSTLVVWMGEFGRTPTINTNTGRDHFPAAWSTVLGGGGIAGGQVYGATTDDGMRVADHPVPVGHLMATICQSLGIDPSTQNMSNIGRPIRIADPDSKPIAAVLNPR